MVVTVRRWQAERRSVASCLARAADAPAAGPESSANPAESGSLSLCRLPSMEDCRLNKAVDQSKA